jgi:hypothetical protein
MLIQQAQYGRAVLGSRIARLAEARRSGDVGASAIELAIITAILVGLAAVVLVVVTQIVNNRSTEIQNNNGKVP